MTANQHGLVQAFVRMLNEHDPDLVDRFVAPDYINHNVFVADGREANRGFWASFFAALRPDSFPRRCIHPSARRYEIVIPSRAAHRAPAFSRCDVRVRKNLASS